ncbi:hypothetical protein LCGC14_0885130 [marine sediment metagenome]|uniref:6-bladed beta-propeller n=1 Tax=marine sediment metagenome TaxID=412755 RepID=A0A0F9S7S0_9ZZZZ
MRKIFFLSAVFWFLTLSYLFFGCLKETQSKEFILIKEFSVGAESGDERYVFAGIENIALDSQENIYVLDRRNYRIHKFDKNGKFLKWIVVEKGNGPKEVSRISGMAVTEKGKIYVQDYNGNKILIFDERANFLRSFIIDFRAVNIIPYSEEMIVVLGVKNNHVLHIFNQEGKYLDSFGEPFEIPTKHSQYKNFPQLKLPTRVDRSRNGKIFLVNPHKYEIRVYEGNEIRRVIRHESESFSPLEIKLADEGRFGMMFPWVPVLEHKTRLYVTMKEFGQDTVHQLDIFEKDNYIGSLKVKGYAYAIDKKGHLYFAEEEEFPRVVRYKKIEK